MNAEKKEKERAWATVQRGTSAPFLRLVLSDGTSLLVQYIHISEVTLNKDATICCIMAVDSRIQIEGQGLSSLITDLQLQAILYVQPGSQAEGGKINRIARQAVETADL